ncbi:hypothetical protein HY78_29865 (plasmid) [Rhizorhabdus wittichii DC-6]|nr:hypothetical protein HY78_29865 [Rhizorhabdus wittichii DC-6]
MTTPARQSFPKNAWFIAAAAEEVAVGATLARKINGEPMVLYRDHDGRVAALAAACPHKGYPLALGRVVGNHLRCGYHGIEFAGDGRCARIPSQDARPSTMDVRAYPVIERDLFIWVWTGTPAEAGKVAPPSFGFEHRPEFHHQLTFSMEAQSNAQFLIENVLDHTHFTYLHAGGFDNDPDLNDDGGEFAGAPLQIETDAHSICVWREFEAMVPNESVSMLFAVDAGQPLARRLETRAWPASGYLVTRDRFWTADGELVSEAIGSGTVTPIDEDHCLHLAAWSSSYRHHPDLKQQIHDIILQDVVAVQHIHRHYADDAAASEVTLNADKAAILSRRMIAAATAAERRATAG